MNQLSLRWRTTPRLWMSSALAAALAIALPARADVVTDWNVVGTTVMPRFGGPPQQYRAMAIASVAAHDALNIIDHRYATYSSNLPSAGPGASPDAAVAAAMRTTLQAMIAALPAPAGTPEAIAAENAARAAALAAIETQYAATLGAGAPDASELAGIAIGEAAAYAILSQRYNGLMQPMDGSGTPGGVADYTPGPWGMGVYQPTPAPEMPAVQNPTFVRWRYVTPFAVNSATQFRAPPAQIFDLKSARYAAEYNQVKLQGDAFVRGTAPDSQLSLIPRFWAGGGLEWDANVRLVAARRGLDRWQHARLFALVNLSIADALITNFDSKYHYAFWRPVTAIRWTADDDGNPATRVDTHWRPFLQTPGYPDYPCGSTAVTGAATQTLRRFFGTDVLGFTRTVNAPALPLPAPLDALAPRPITRKYVTLSAAEHEQARARVYSGIHFLEGCTAGIRMGNQVADWVYDHKLRP